jgi:hypothetical protein
MLWQLAPATTTTTKRTATALDYVAAWISDGGTLKQLAFAIGQSLGYEVGRERISAYLRDTFGAAAVSDALASARTRASYSLVEDAIGLVDEEADDSISVQRAASRARARQWTAERYNQAAFGSQKGVSVSVTVGSLHLDALRSLPARVTATVVAAEHAALPASTADAQVIDSE